MLEDINRRRPDQPNDQMLRPNKAMCLDMFGESLECIDQVKKAARDEKNSKLLELTYIAKGVTVLRMAYTKTPSCVSKRS